MSVGLIDKDHPWNRWTIWGARACCVASVALGVILLCLMAGNLRLDVDEIEHAHAAWLMFQGQSPFTDFWEHHPPWYWHFLTLYYSWFGEDYGVFQWGRAWMIGTFVMMVTFTYLTGRQLFNDATGLLGACLLGLYNALAIPAVQMRPDGWMMALLMAGVYCFVRFWKNKFTWYQASLAGLLLGMAFSTHPRSGFTVLALALMVGFSCWRVTGWRILKQRKPGIACFVVFSFLPILLPFFIYGPSVYLSNMYIWSASPLPKTSPWPFLREHFFDGYMIIPLILFSIPICFVDMTRKRTQLAVASAALLGLVILNLIGVVIHSRPFAQSLFPLAPFLALLAGRGAAWMADQIRPPHAWIGLSLLMLGNLLLHLPYAIGKPQDGFTPHVEQLRSMSKLVGPTRTYAGPLQYHPVFCQDGIRYWLDLNMEGMKTFKSIDPNFRFNLVDALAANKPFVIHQGIENRLTIRTTARGAVAFKPHPYEVNRLRALLSKSYEPVDGKMIYRLKRPSR